MVAGMCCAVLGITGLMGYQLTETQAKTVYWELSSDAEMEEDVPQLQNEAQTGGIGNASDAEVSRDTAKEWAGSKLADAEYADYVAKEFQYLEKFDVTFDKKTNMFYYDSRKIRWLIDELADTNTQKCCYNENGVIDVYTVRDKNGDLEGVRVAGDEEFRQKTDRMNSAVLLEKGDSTAEEGNETAVVKDQAGSYDGSYESVESTYVIDVIEEGTSYDGSSEASGGESAAGFGSSNADVEVCTEQTQAYNTAQGYDEFTENDLFSALGLTSGKNHHWLYKGREVAAIYIKDISITTWGDVENGVYLYVTKEQREDSVTWNIQEVTKREFEDIIGMRQGF